MIRVKDYEYMPVYYIGESIQTLHNFMQTLDVPKQVFSYKATPAQLYGVRNVILIIGHGGIAKIQKDPDLGANIQKAISTGRVTAMLEQDYRELVGC